MQIGRVTTGQMAHAAGTDTQVKARPQKTPSLWNMSLEKFGDLVPRTKVVAVSTLKLAELLGEDTLANCLGIQQEPVDDSLADVTWPTNILLPGTIKYQLAEIDGIGFNSKRAAAIKELFAEHDAGLFVPKTEDVTIIAAFLKRDFWGLDSSSQLIGANELFGRNSNYMHTEGGGVWHEVPTSNALLVLGIA